MQPTSKLPTNGFLGRLANAAPDSHALWTIRAERGSNIAHAISINRSGSREKIGPGAIEASDATSLVVGVRP